ncbi:MAG TPA: DNA oxidative demethylase AlkB [Alphaproteobacteria bacterium]|nr:DNA oxidative demethylase AlkB [Alphaproteobacteria bacterium]
MRRDRDLFAALRPAAEPIRDGVVLLHGFARDPAILAAVRRVQQEAPPRRMTTPGGYTMSVAMTSCGDLGWVTDRSGYRYDAVDPASGSSWPAIPSILRVLANDAAAAAGFPAFNPDSCLINLYEPGARLSLHQDRNERDLSQPIVSVSLGLPAVFLFGGLSRSDPARPIPLDHGDVVVFFGPARLAFHGVRPLKAGDHPQLGACRVNLTFRRAG